MSEAWIGFLGTCLMVIGGIITAVVSKTYKKSTSRKKSPQDRLDYILDYNERQLKDRDVRLEKMQLVVDGLRDEINELRDENAELLRELKKYRVDNSPPMNGVAI